MLRAENAHKEKIEYRSAACGERVEPKAQQANCVNSTCMSFKIAMHMFESNDRYGATAKVPSMPAWR